MKFNFVRILALISIIGYLGLFLESLIPTVNFSEYATAMLFIIIGIFLLIAGGVNLIVKYFEDNVITLSEFGKIIMILFGAVSVLIGVLENPSVNITLPFFNYFKMVISALAIIVIVYEAFIDDGVL